MQCSIAEPRLEHVFNSSAAYTADRKTLDMCNLTYFDTAYREALRCRKAHFTFT